jgi:hypothetical protein
MKYTFEVKDRVPKSFVKIDKFPDGEPIKITWHIPHDPNWVFNKPETYRPSPEIQALHEWIAEIYPPSEPKAPTS